MLAATLRRHGGNRAFHDLQQRLLHAFARHVTRDRRVVGLAADLVHFVDIDDAALGAFDVVVGGLKQFQNDVLDVFADVTGFGQRRGVGHREGHIKNAGERLGEQRLAATRRADQQDVGLRQFDVVVLGRVIEALVMIVHGNGEHALGMHLADDIIIQHFADFLWRGNAVTRLHERGFVFLTNDVHAELNTLVTDKNCRTRNKLTHFMLALAAERAVERILGVAAADLAHRGTPWASNDRSLMCLPQVPNRNA